MINDSLNQLNNKVMLFRSKSKKKEYKDVNFDTFPAEYKSILVELMNEDGVERKKHRAKLVDIGEPVITHLAELLHFDNHTLRWEAAKTLEQLAHHSSIEHLIIALEDSESDIRWIAAEALSKMGEKVVVPLLQTIIDNGTKSVNLIKGTYHVLHKIEVDDELKEKLKPIIKTLNRRRSVHEQLPIMAKSLVKELNG